MKKIFLMALAVLLVLSSCSKAKDTGSATAVLKDTNTVAVSAVVIVRDDVPEDVVYSITKNIFDNTDAIASLHSKGYELDADFASSVAAVPYHAGAARYFAEKGKTVASVKAGSGKGKVGRALMFGTGGDTGTYYGFGSVLAGYITNNTPYNITAVTSGGSKANVEDLTAGDVSLAFVQSDVMSYAYNGERLFDTKLDGFSVLAALYMEQVQLVTVDSSIASVKDLAGKTVSVGAIGSGVYFNAVDVLDAYGLSLKDIKPVYQSFGDSADSLKDGKIDAAFVVAGAPTTAVSDLATAKNVYLVNIDGSEAASLLAGSPFYSTYVIPAGTYGGK